MSEVSRSSRLALASLVAGAFLSACQPPQKRNAEPDTSPEPPPAAEPSVPSEPVAPPPPIQPASRPQPTPEPALPTPEPVARVPLAPAPKPIFRPPPKVTARSVAILKDNTEWPSLLVEETEPDKPGGSASLRVSGEMRSQAAFRSAIARLHEALPGHRITVDVTYGPHIRATAWSDRLDTLWGTFFHQIDGGTWQHESGLTTLRGEAESSFAIESLTRFHENLMKGSAPHRVDNFLTVP